MPSVQSCPARPKSDVLQLINCEDEKTDVCHPSRHRHHHILAYCSEIELISPRHLSLLILKASWRLADTAYRRTTQSCLIQPVPRWTGLSSSEDLTSWFCRSSRCLIGIFCVQFPRDMQGTQVYSPPVVVTVRCTGTLTAVDCESFTWVSGVENLGWLFEICCCSIACTAARRHWHDMRLPTGGPAVCREAPRISKKAVISTTPN